jgi:hypothetical protein
VALSATGGVMAMTRLPIGPIRACPETSALFRGAMEEAAAVGRGVGVPLPEDCADRQPAELRRVPRPEALRRGHAGRLIITGTGTPAASAIRGHRQRWATSSPRPSGAPLPT